jgi:hypothetical protein
MIAPAHVRSSIIVDRARFYPHADRVDGLAYGTRAVGQKRSNVKGPESKKVRNMCGPSFVISVELRSNAVKRSHRVPRATPSTDRFLSVLAHLVPRAGPDGAVRAQEKKASGMRKFMLVAVIASLSIVKAARVMRQYLIFRAKTRGEARVSLQL